jgi:TetR/AcrR family transcriptional repressor of uid operon
MPSHPLTPSAEPAREANRNRSLKGPTSRGTAGTRARQRAETRERIFEMALREFREVGFGAAQIDRIARDAGVARGTFYFHFAAKDDVLLELARRINERIAHRVVIFSDSGASIEEILLRVNDAVMDEHSRVGEAGLLSEMLSLYVRRPHDMGDPAHNLPTLSGKLAGHLRAARERGEVHHTMSSDQTALVFMTSLFGVYTRLRHGEALWRAC